MRLSLLGLLLLAAAAVAWPVGAGAQAKVCAGHPKDPSVVCARDSAHIVDVCDRAADGHRVFARVVTKSTYPAYRAPYYDSNDSKDGLLEPPLPQPGRVDPDLRPDRGLRRGPDDRRRAAGQHDPAAADPHTRPDPGAHAHSGARAAAAADRLVQLGVGLGCAPRGKRMLVTLTVHKRKGKRQAARQARRLLLPQEDRGKRVVARTDRSRPYRRTLPIQLAPGPHHVYARAYYKRPGSKKLRRKTVVRRFTVCA